MTDSEDYLGASYTYQFDQLSSISKPGTSYAMSYNGHNELSSISVGTSVLAAYSYTNDRNRYLSSLAYGNGDVVEYTYDDLGRVTREEYRENGSTAISRTVTYTYNETGNLSKMTDSQTGMTTTYSYDPLGRLISAYETDGTSKKSSAYSYYGNGDLKAESYLINSTWYKTVYEYDGLRRVTKVHNGDLTSDYEYDIFSRLAKKTTFVGETKVIEELIGYKSPSEGATSNRINSFWTVTDDDCVCYWYTYDKNGNIYQELKANADRVPNVEGIQVTYSEQYSTFYYYDTFDRLIRENNQKAEKTWIWTYDNAGNITSKKEYAYSTMNPEGNPVVTQYTYGNSNWGDLLTSYDGRTITYDAIGNPLSDGIWNYTWEQGRRLVKMQSGTTTWNYTYDTRGLRTGRTNGTTNYKYWYNDSGLLLRMEKGNTVYSFTYDPAGRPVSVTEGSTRYYYVLNQQGDVIGLMNSNKKLVVEYIYDAWGRLISTTGTLAATLGTNNPLRYRGYVYDTETGLYYLQSRYYNPEMGRFINADSQLTTKNATGVNLFAYCYNNPVMYADPSGLAPEWWQWAISGVMFLTGVALIATGFGSSVGGVLVCASTNSIVNSYLSEAAGGSSTAGWLGGMITGAFCGIGAGIAGNLLTSATNSVGFACLGKAIAGYGAAFGFGVAGSYAGQITSAAIEGKTLDEKRALESALATGVINCFAGVGAGMGNAIKDMPIISTTSKVCANTINAGWSVVSETIVDTLSVIINLFG